MKFPQKKVYLIRHGETEWTLSDQHTGLTDIPLTKNGEKQAERLRKRLHGHPFASVFTSPLQRAVRTCEIAGLLKNATQDPDLTEWNYGELEGLTSQEIWKIHPDWTIFSKGAPKGESIADIGSRANRVLTKLRSIHGDIALFSHGHFLRVLAARWLQLSVQEGRLFVLAPASLSSLGFEKTTPVLTLWNDTSHLGSSNYTNPRK